MEKTLDRISQLPDPVLQSILDLLPMKFATRTKILSRRWADLWTNFWCFSANLDFGKEFSSNQTPEDFVATLNRYLLLHNGKKIRWFSLFFSPIHKFRSDVETWMAFAIRKHVEELDLDFSQGFDTLTAEFTNGGRPFCVPDFLFHCESLRSLKLGHWKIGNSSNFSELYQLQTISLANVSITEETLQSMLANCSMLETLILKKCLSLESIKVSGKQLQLKRLVVVDCQEAYEIEILAPKLESFIYYGECNFKNDFSYQDGSSSFIDISSLVDAFISSFGLEHSEPEHDYIHLLSEISQVKILTVCTATLMCVTIWEEFKSEQIWPIVLPNLDELQLLISLMDSEYINYIYGFFRLCCYPQLEKLFVQLPTTPENSSHESNEIEFPEEPLDVAFHKLKVIKLSNFKGSESEIRLARFLLKRAAVLETLVLVSPEKFEGTSGERIDLAILHMQLYSSPKASPEAKIVTCHYSDDDKSLCPTHTEYYCEF